MKLFRELFQWLKGKQTSKTFPTISQNVVVPDAPKRKNRPVTLLSKSGTRYRLIKHVANKKANSPAYTQRIVLN